MQKGHYVTIKGLIQQENVTMVNAHVPFALTLMDLKTNIPKNSNGRLQDTTLQKT